MKIKPSYDQETDVPEPYRDLYTETGGKWVLTEVEGIRNMAAVEATLKTERKARQEADAKLAKFAKLGDRDPDALLKAVEEAETMRERIEELETEAAEGGGKAGKPGDEEAIKARIERATASAKTKHDREIEKFKAEIAAARKEAEEHKTTASTLDGRIRRSTIEGEIQRQAAAQKVRPEAMPDVLLYAAMFDLDEDGKVRARDGVGLAPGLDVSSWFSDMKTAGRPWWPDSVGGGARPGSGGAGGSTDNPFSKTSPNLSKAAKLMQADSAKAEQFARTAGFGSAKAAIEAMADAAAKRVH